MSKDAETTDDAPKKKKGGFMKFLLIGLVLIGAGGGGTYAAFATGMIGGAHEEKEDTGPQYVLKGETDTYEIKGEKDSKGGKAVLLSSHILDELGDLCHSLTILELGKVMEHGALDKIRQRHASGQTVSVRVAEGVKALQDKLEKIELAGNPRIEGDAMHFDLPGGDAELSEVSKALQAEGLTLLELHPVKGEISNIYFKATKGEVQ